MKQLVSSLNRFVKDEAGTASIEFIFAFPFVVLIFCGSFEGAMYTLRTVSLERSVDIVVRDLRLGTLGSISHWALKREICERAIFLGDADDCQQSLQIELQPIDTTNFAMPNIPVVCRDTRVPIDPAVNPDPSGQPYTLGDGNQIILMRVCLQSDPMFPTTVYWGRMNTVSPDGSYSIVSATTFVNEPRD
jgi:Flp pilus assembly pilin Flp